MPELLTETRAGVEKHWNFLKAELNRVLPRSGGRYTFDQPRAEGRVINLICSNFSDQRVDRERGGVVPIVPLLEREDGVPVFWMSLTQSWHEPERSTSQRLVYSSTGLTVFSGAAGDVDKDQLFRVEWAGLKPGSFGGVPVFEAPGAGHPHWQFDLNAAQGRRHESERQQFLEVIRLLEDEHEVEEFGVGLVGGGAPREARDEFLARLSRVHFASWADWARSPWLGDVTSTEQHARSPSSVKEILNWVVSCILYLRQELSRM